VVVGLVNGPAASINVEGLAGTTAMLRDAAARGEDMRPAMGEIRELFIAGHRSQFTSRGAFLGTPWARESPETIARKSRSTIPSLGRVLVEGGGLEEALSGGAGSRTRVSKGSVSVGVDRSLFRALFAQGGASGGRRGVEPKRPVLGINDLEKNTALRILTDYLLGR
jgi:hypothetical protein